MRKINAVLRFFLHREDLEQEIAAELLYHLDRQTEQNIGRGMDPEAARRAATLSVGSLTQMKEECRQARAGHFVETLLQDVRYGIRVLLKNPGFSLMVVLTLALGIGVNTAIFSLVYGVLLRPLPYQKAGQLVVLHQQANRAGLLEEPFSAKEIFDYRDQNHTLDGLVEHHTMVFLLLGKDFAERVETAVVSANFFDVLGVRPLMGRTFVASDETPNSDAVLILSNKYWRQHQGADPDIVGKVFQMNNRPHTVIGVLPPIPQYPRESDVYMPTSQCPTRSSARFIANRRARMMIAFGRLKPGISLPKAQADLSVVATQLEKAYPDAYPKAAGYGISAAPLQDELTRRARITFLVLLGAAALVLLIACANVANLLLARLLKLERELAVRAALGAGKLRLLRQLLTESVLLSVTGGALGLALAPSALGLLVTFASRFTTRAAEIKIDAPVLLFTLLLSLCAGLLFGLAPLFSSGQNLGESMKQGGARSSSTRARRDLRSLLVISQVAVSFILLIGAGLMIRSFLILQRVEPGFNPTRLLTLRITPNFSRYVRPEQFQLLSETVLQKTRAVPGVESSSLASNFPFSPGGIQSGPGTTSFQIEGRPVSKGELAPLVDTTVVSAQYFSTIRQPLVRGRLFNVHDDRHAPLVAVINQAMARHRWPNEDPVGKRVSFDDGETWVTIIGVTGDVKEYGLHRPIGDELYTCLEQVNWVSNLVIRTSLNPMSVAPAVRAAIRAIDPQLAIDRVDTVENLEYESEASPRVTTTLLGLFAALALLISACGVAAVMALSVTQRTQEMGIRMALGAPRSSIVKMVLREGLTLCMIGAVLGVAGSVALTRLLSSLLFGTSPTDTATFAAVSAVFLAVAAIACFIPARQVTAIDPLTALRQE